MAKRGPARPPLVLGSRASRAAPRPALLGGGGGSRGSDGSPGMFPFTPPATGDVDRIPVVRVSGGSVNFDYLACDDVEFGDRGVPVGRYLSAASGNLRTALVSALAANPSAVRFLLPAGDHAMSSITEAAGLRNNLVFSGAGAERCRLYRESAGQMFLWQNDGPQNLVFEDLTLDIDSAAATPFSASLNMSNAHNVLVRRCRFLANFEDAVSDGTNHGVFLLGGSQIHMRDCYLLRSQAVLCGLGRGLVGATFLRNVVEDANDLGVSIVSDTDLVLSDIKIAQNVMTGKLLGGGFIYVGSDGASTNPSLMQDISIEDNSCSGTIDPQLNPASAIGIILPWATVNKRISIRGNKISNSNHDSERANVRAIAAFLRTATMTSASEISIEGNSCDFASEESLAAITITGNGIEALQVLSNLIGLNTRGIEIGGCSNVDISRNIVRDSTSNALSISSAEQAMRDIRVRDNYLRTTAAFKAAIQSSGDNSQTVFVERNRLISSLNSWHQTLSAGTLTAYYNNNIHDNGLNASVSGGTIPQNLNNAVLADGS